MKILVLWKDIHGVGCVGVDFTWSGPLVGSPGEVNDGQNINC